MHADSIINSIMSFWRMDAVSICDLILIIGYLLIGLLCIIAKVKWVIPRSSHSSRKSRSQAIFIGTTSFLNYTLAFGVGILVFFVCYNRSYNSSLSLLFLWLSDPSDWRITNLSAITIISLSLWIWHVTYSTSFLWWCLYSFGSSWKCVSWIVFIRWTHIHQLL